MQLLNQLHGLTASGSRPMKHERQLARILEFSMPHLLTMELTHLTETLDDFDVSAMTHLQSLQLIVAIRDLRNGACLDSHLVKLLHSIRQHQVRLTHLHLRASENTPVSDTLLDAVLSIATLRQVTLDLP